MLKKKGLGKSLDSEKNQSQVLLQVKKKTKVEFLEVNKKTLADSDKGSCVPIPILLPCLFPLVFPMWCTIIIFLAIDSKQWLIHIDINFIDYAWLLALGNIGLANLWSDLTISETKYN